MIFTLGKSGHLFRVGLQAAGDGGQGSLRALRHLSCSHLAGQGAGCMAWACRPGLGLDFLSCVTSAFCWYLGMEDSVLGVPDI